MFDDDDTDDDNKDDHNDKDDDIDKVVKILYHNQSMYRFYVGFEVKQ